MTVDFAFKRAPEYRVATVNWKGPWSDRKIRSKFEEVARWASKNGLRTGKWIFLEPGTGRWEVGIEIKSKAPKAPGIRLKTLKGATVASVTFDPEEVSPRVVWHGLSDWTRWRKRDGEIKGVRSAREVYEGNPWTDKRAFARTEVQFVVRK